MAGELEAVAKRAVDEAVGAGAEDAEAWAEGSRDREVRVHAGEVESLTEASERGVGIRAWIGGRSGYAFGTDLSEEGLAQLGASAAAAARVADADEHAAPPDAAGEAKKIEGLHDEAVATTETKDVIELAQSVERAALDVDKVTGVEDVVYVDSDGEAALASSRGPSGSFAISQCYAYLQALSGENGEVQTGLGFGVGRSPRDLEPESIGAEAGDEAASMLGAGKPKSRSCPVVLNDRVAASFAGFIGGALSADEVQRGRSPFADRLGQVVASPLLTLVDDPTDARSIAADSHDGEGLACRRNVLIEDGVLQRFLHNSYTGRRSGTASTGSAVRTARSLPSVGVQAMATRPGARSWEDLLGGVELGLMVQSMNGLHSGVNPTSGDFSVGVEGLMIRRGELAEPVREVTVASTLQRLLVDIVAVGSEIEWLPSGAGCSALLIGEVALSGA